MGSKALTARRRMRVSSSTVRYELAELEERGYLTHPHTSAGRVPTDHGYRFYVDRLLESLAPKPTDLALDLSGVRNEVDAALETTIAALTQVTHLLALATAPSLETTVVRHVEVLVLQPQVVVVVIITSTGGVTKRLFVFDGPVDPGLADWAPRVPERAGRRAEPRRPPPAQPLRRSVSVRPGSASFSRSSSRHSRSSWSWVSSGSTWGVPPGLMDDLRSEDITTFQRLLETLERRAVLLDLLKSALDTKRPFVRVGSEFDGSRVRKARARRRAVRAVEPQPRDGEPARPEPDGLRQGDRRRPLGRGPAVALRRGDLRGVKRGRARRRLPARLP